MSFCKDKYLTTHVCKPLSLVNTDQNGSLIKYEVPHTWIAVTTKNVSD